jgi:predicted kinase
MTDDDRSDIGCRPSLLVISGPPCAGKSTLADALHREGGACLDVDRVRQAVIPDSDQSERDRDIAYAAMHVLAKELLEAHVSPVIVAATYKRLEQRQHLRDAFADSRTAVLVVQCTVDPATAVERFRHRQPGHAALDLTNESVRRAASEYVLTPEEALVVDTTRDLGQCARIVREWVREGRTTRLARWCARSRR